MGDNVELTIGIVVYNGAKYLKRCLDSVVTQKKLKSCEIICVDDGSTDGSLDVLKTYEQTYSQLRIIIQENKGAYRARHRVVEEAKGEWIGFVDCDDEIKPNMYEILLKKGVNSDADMVVCPFEKIDQKSGKVQCVQMKHFKDAVISVDKEMGMWAAINPAYWNKIYRTDRVRRSIKVDVSTRIMEDLIFFGGIVPQIRRVCFVQEPLYRYYDNPNSLTKTIGEDDLVAAEEAARQLIEEFRLLEDGDAYKDLLNMLVFLHVGLAFSINMTSPDISTADVYRATKSFMTRELGRWNENKYLTFPYALRHRQILVVYLSFVLYKTPLFVPIVEFYRLLNSLFGIDIKW